MKYRPEIDGLRAVAVIPVIFFHAGISMFGGGYVGVDVFFVISGYLITSIITSEIKENRFSIINFYERRARRIMPMLFLMALVTIPFALVELYPTDMRDYSESLIAVFTFSSNIFFWLKAGYFDLASELRPMLHTWSLALEEQYYLIFPGFLILTRSFKHIWVVLSILILTLLSLSLAEWGAYNIPTSTFFLLTTRIWELATGALIAMMFNYYNTFSEKLVSNSMVNELLSILGLFMILYSVFVFDKSTPFPSFYALLPVLGSGLIIIFSSAQNITGKFLSFKPVVLVGLFSYSAYLWHQPMIAFAKYISFPEPQLYIILLIILLVFPLSYLSYRFIEQPFRNKTLFNRKRIFQITIIGSSLFILFGCLGHFTEGFKGRSIVSNLAVLNYQPDNHYLGERSMQPIKDISKNTDSYIINNKFERKLWFNGDDKRKKLLIVGNSHSHDMYNILSFSKQAESNFQIARFGVQMRNVFVPNEMFFDSPNYIHSDIIMFCSNYSKYDMNLLGSIIERIKKDNKKIVIVRNVFLFQNFGVRTYADMYIQNKVKNSPLVDLDIPKIVADINKDYYKEFMNQRSQKFSDIAMENMKGRYTDIILLDRMDYICDNDLEQCYVINEKLEKYVFDAAHNTLEGAKFYGKRVDEVGWLDKLIVP
jgi:peptidoglycan/LPS O-acetylase OafA/YrhL